MATINGSNRPNNRINLAEAAQEVAGVAFNEAVFTRGDETVLSHFRTSRTKVRRELLVPGKTCFLSSGHYVGRRATTKPP